MENYVVVDVETCNRESDICSICVLEIKNHNIVHIYYSLINPNSYFEPINVQINHITANDVINAPNFLDFYNSLNGLLENNIIVVHGGNNYDLNAISKSLKLNNSEKPIFNFFDTCTLSKRFLDLPNYKLNTVADYINYEFNHHDAKEDTIATYKIFEYLNQNFNIGQPISFPNRFNINSSKPVDENKMFIKNVLIAISDIENFKSIKSFEIDRLEMSLENNKLENESKYINSIKEQIKTVVLNRKMEYQNLKKIYDYVISSKKISITRLKSFVVNTTFKLIDNLISDNLLTKPELEEIYNHLNQYNFLASDPLFSPILEKMDLYITNNNLTLENLSELLDSLKTIIYPIRNTTELTCDDFAGRKFCLTQAFSHFNSRKDLELLLIKLGANKSGITKSLDYLIVGSIQADGNAYGCYGTKVQKVLDNINKGSKTRIIGENDLPKELFETNTI